MMMQGFENELYDGDDDDVEESKATRKHDEDTLSFQNRFFEDAAKLYSNFTCNPFKLGELTRIDDTPVRFDPIIIADTKLLESNGEQQFNMLGNDRTIHSKAPVNDTIKKNCFCLMDNAVIVFTKRSYAYTGHSNKIKSSMCCNTETCRNIFSVRNIW